MRKISIYGILYACFSIKIVRRFEPQYQNLIQANVQGDNTLSRITFFVDFLSKILSFEPFEMDFYGFFLALPSLSSLMKIQNQLCNKKGFKTVFYGNYGCKLFG